MKRTLILACALWAMPQLATAASGIKPGLWEIQTQTALPGGMVMPDISQLPPEVAAKMAQHGISLRGGSGGGVSARVCVTREQAARDEPPQPPDSRCRNTSFRKSGNTINWQMVCNDGGRSMTGRGTMTLDSAESYSGSTTMTVSDPQHGTLSTSTQMQGRWIGNCQ